MFIQVIYKDQEQDGTQNGSLWNTTGHKPPCWTMTV